MISHEVDNGIYRVKVEGEMTIYHALEHKQALLECLGHCTEMEINLSGVSEMDTTGFQLLVLAKREAEKIGRPMRLVAHSPATLEVMDLFSMAGYFGDPVVMPG